MAPKPQRLEVKRLQQLASSLCADTEPANVGFPIADIFPRDETQAGAFVKEHPTWDGRGIKVAIFDTGVDLGAGGLAVTTTGLPKIIDCVDATGSGDVDTSTVLDGDNSERAAELRGQTGRTLVIPACTRFSNPSGRWHVGMLSAYQLFPGPLVTRLRRERKSDWDESQRRLEQRLEEEIAAASSSGEHDGEALADLRLRLGEARALAGNEAADPGPLFDVVAWHDGACWRAAVDTSEAGDLAQAQPMRDFKLAQEFGTFGPSGDSADAWLLNYNLNVYSDGNIVEVVTNAGAHGTHVAATTAAYFPEQPELNGIAPGAQIVSVKVGDSRLGSAETGTGMIRGLIHAINAGVHLINMSFGEATSLAHAGRIGELLEEAIHRHGIIFVTSAGNSGPGLGTVGSPAAQAVGTISVGALISPAMMKMEYAMRPGWSKADDDGRGVLTTWSARGPTLDGALGVTVCAPGAAIASVPQDTLTSMMMMNGTSMASPNACGGVALVLCAAVANSVDWTSESVKAVIESTAANVVGQEAWAQGHGILQVQSAWEALRAKNQQQPNPLVWFDVSVGVGDKGVYLRELEETRQPLEVSVSITPRFRRGPEGDDLDRAAKVDWHVRVNLECGDDFVSVPEHILLMSEARMFSVLVDPCHPSLACGEVVYSEVRGRDSETGEVLFRVPVTIALPVVPAADTTASFAGLSFTPGKLHRKFVAVPAGATQMSVTITAINAPPQGNRTFMLHLSQRIRGRKYSDTESVINMAIGAYSKIVHTCDCEPSYAMELCLGQFWSSLGDGSIIDVEVAFFGLETSAAPTEAGPGPSMVPRLSLSAMQPVTAVHVRASLRQAMLAPSASLTAVETACSASSYSITPLDRSRDMWPSGNRLFKQLVLTYELDVAVAGRTTLRVPLISDVLYESAYDSQLVHVFDSRNRYVGATDFHTSPVSLAKGRHTVLVQVRHEDEAALQALANMSPALAVSRACAPVAVHCSGEFQGGSARAVLKRGGTATVYVNAPALSEADRQRLAISRGTC
jgi:tripeptidyl-peptidase-2